MPKTFARLDEAGVVVELIEERENIEDEWHPTFIEALHDITGAEPAVAIGHVYANNTFSAPIEVVPSPSIQMLKALGSGCNIVSTDTPAISATYDTIGVRWKQMKNETQYISIFGGFSAGVTELDWPAMSGEVIFSKPDQFKAVTRAISDWITEWQRFVDGKLKTVPELPRTIA